MSIGYQEVQISYSRINIYVLVLVCEYHTYYVSDSSHITS